MLWVVVRLTCFNTKLAVIFISPFKLFLSPPFFSFFLFDLLLSHSVFLLPPSLVLSYFIFFFFFPAYSSSFPLSKLLSPSFNLTSSFFFFLLHCLHFLISLYFQTFFVDFWGFFLFFLVFFIDRSIPESTLPICLNK